MNKIGINDFCSRDESLLSSRQSPLHPLLAQCHSDLYPRGDGGIHPRGTLVWSLQFIVAHCFLDPVQKARDSGVDIWRCPILFSKGDDALGHAVTHKGAPRGALWAERGGAEPDLLQVWSSVLPQGGWSLLGALADIRDCWS